MKARMLQLLALLLLLVVSYFVVLVFVRGPVTVYRMATNGVPTIRTYQIFPQRVIEAAPTAAPLTITPRAGFPETVTLVNLVNPSQSKRYRWDDLFAQTETRAFIVIQNDTVIYERYFNGANRETVHPSFSVTKSFVSTLIGIAISEGKIGSVKDRVIRYLPELTGRGLDQLTIKDLLRMSSGIPFEDFDNVFPLLLPFSDDPRIHYSTNLREVALGVRAGSEPIGATFRYNDYHLLLEGLILERVTGVTVSNYLQEKIWKPSGMAYPASWSLDSEADGFEKTEAGLNARAIDFARFGLLFLHQGQVDGKQIVPAAWVATATTPDPEDKRAWSVVPIWPQIGGYYKYHWWGLRNADGTYDYMARGDLGQIIYVSPAKNAVVVRFGNGPHPDSVWPMAIRAFLVSLSEGV